MVCKIICCSEFPDIPDKAGRKTRRRTQAIAKRYVFHANAINLDSIKDNNTYGVFEKTFLEIFDKQAPLKTKILRHNSNSFMSKELKKNIMLRSKLKNSFNNDRSYENWCKYKQQRNFCVDLLRITKRNFFKNLNVTKISDNRTF